MIGKLSSGDAQHINYRDSKLTRILQNSLGGNAKTAIICAVTPAAMSEEQTLSTLRFAMQAKTIKNHAKVNEVLDDAAKINRLKKEMAAMKVELVAAQAMATTNREVELQEALDQATKDKEDYLRYGTFHTWSMTSRPSTSVIPLLTLSVQENAGGQREDAGIFPGGAKQEERHAAQAEEQQEGDVVRAQHEEEHEDEHVPEVGQQVDTILNVMHCSNGKATVLIHF